MYKRQGLSVHGGYRVVTEHAVLAMPETAIGFVPDVGASHFLPRLAPGWGRYLGLTGARVGAGGALRSGLATHLVPRVELTDLLAALARDGVAALGPPTAPPAADDDGDETALLETFTDVPVPQLDAVLAARPGQLADEARSALRTVCPGSVAMTDRLLRLGARSSLDECLGRELDTVREVITGPDFDEGVRCALVDRGATPTWTDTALTSGGPQ